MRTTRTPAALKRLAICLALTTSLLVPTLGTANAKVSTAKASCQKPSGEPIPIFYIAQLAGPTSQTNYHLAVEAATKSINCAGGVKGRPLDLTQCNGNTLVDPNLGQNCARDAIAAGAVAAPGIQVLDGAVITTLSNAGIPTLGTPVTTPALVLPTSFSVTGGVPASLTSLAARLYDEGARKIRLISLDSPQVGAFVTVINNAMKPRGFTLLDPVLFPTDPSADDSALIQAAMNGADALIIAQTLEGIQKIVPELYAAGWTGKIGINATTIPPNEPAIQHKGIILSQGLYPPTATNHKAVRDFNADMAKYAPKLGRPTLDGDLSAWLSVQIVADALKQAATIDAPALLNVLNAYKVPFDVGPPIDFAKGGSLGLPRLFTSGVVILELKDKKYYEDGIVDAAAPPPTTTTTKAK